MSAEKSRPAWSSDPVGARPAGSDPAASLPLPPTGPVRVRLERQGRGGKVVTVVENLPGHPARIEEIAKTLKSRCGAGGTVKGRIVEVQGDHRDRIVGALAELGLPAKPGKRLKSFRKYIGGQLLGFLNIADETAAQT